MSAMKKRVVSILLTLLMVLAGFVGLSTQANAVGSIDVTPSQLGPYSSGGESPWYDGRRTYKDGSFYLYIQHDNVTKSKIKISLTRSSAPGWANSMSKSYSYTAKISGTNAHNVTFSNGSKTMSISTKLADDGTYVIMNFPLVITKPAHYIYKDQAFKVGKNITQRFNFKKYNQGNTGAETVNTTAMKTHKTSDQRISINIQANTTVVGVRTTWTDGARPVYRAQNSAAIINFTRPKYNLSIQHAADLGDRNVVFKSASKVGSYNCDSTVNLSESWATTPPSGFAVRENLGSVSMGTSAKTATMYYDPIDYNITYDLSGGSLDESYPKTYTVLNSIDLSSLPKPQNPGYIFVGWELDGKSITGINEGIDNSKITASNISSEMNKRQKGNITLKAKWEMNDCNLRIEKNIPKDSVNMSYGDPVAIFKVTGTDVEGNNHSYEVPLKLSDTGQGYYGDVKSLTVPAGTYTVSEVKVSRYDISDIYCEGATRNGNTVVCDLVNNDTSTVIVYNALTNNGKFSHSDMENNVFYKQPPIN